MKNLKRVLSLGLASVMLLGMMVVGASAKDFTDADEIAHGEAVNTLVALNIVKGKEDGSYFDPQGNVTRGEMAKMISVALSGGSEDAAGVKTTPSFTDIRDHWAEPFIEYCADLSIISGRGDGTFDPNGNVTGMEATKMVLTALGYDADAYKLNGASWAVNTDQQARRCDPALYEGLGSVSMNAPATRDIAAQIIWNGMQNETRVTAPEQNKNNGELVWGYIGSQKTMLKERYGADIWYGKYAGNGDSMSSVDDGCIYIDNAGFDTTAVGSRNATAWFPSDLSIDNMGEEVKVVYKDVNGGIPNKPDKKDVIYGVFNTGTTVVYHTTKDALQNVTSATKLKFGGTEYDTAASSITVVTDYIGTGTAVATSTIKSTSTGGWRDQQLIDEIKFVCDDNGKIVKAYVTTIGAARVTSVSASKVTLSGVGTIDIDDNDIYEDIAKDDVVVYTKFYNTDKDKALFTVTKAETEEGELTGWKVDGGNLVNVAVDGETTKVAGKPAASTGINGGTALTDDAIIKLGSGSDDGAIGDTVRIYLAKGMVVAMEALEQSGGKYALIIDSDSSANPTNTIGGTGLNPFRVTVLLPDGSKETLKVHKDSTVDASASNVVAGSATASKTAASNLTIGALVEYTSITDGSIKIKNIASGAVSGETYGKGAVSVAAKSGATNGKTQVWNKDTKVLKYDDAGSAVAAADAVLFVAVDTSAPQNPTLDSNSKFYAYDLRSLGNLNLENASAGVANVGVSVFKNSDGLVKAAFVTLAAKPGTAGVTTRYGIVSNYVGTRKIDGDTYYRYEIAVDEDTTVTVNVSSNSAISKGDVVKFDERADEKYDAADFNAKFGATENTTEKLSAPIAVKEYKANEGILVAYAGTNKPNASSGFVGTGTPVTYTVSKDVKLYYVNADGQKAGEETGVSAFAADTGYANAVFHYDDDGVIDVIVVETSNKKNILRNPTLSAFGVKAEATNAAAAPTITTAKGAAYTVTMDPGATGQKLELGSTIKITIKCTTAPSSNETITLTGTGLSNISAAVVFGTGDLNAEKEITCTVGSANTTLTYSLGVS